MYSDKITQSVAEAAKKVMDEELKGQQHKIDKNKNNKIDAHDFKLLRKEETVDEAMQKSDVPAYLRKQQGEKPLTVADVKSPRKDSISASANLAKARNEEVEQIDEDNLSSIAKKHGMEFNRTTYGAGMKHPKHGEISINRYGEWNHKGTKSTGDSSNNFASLDKHLSSMKEEVEQIDEADIEKTATGVKVYGSSYGNSQRARREQIKRPVDDAKGPKMKELSDIEAEKKKKKKFSEMVESYTTGGIKSLFASLVKEEPSNDEYKQEVADQQAKSEGKKKQPDLTKGLVQAVKNEEVEIEVLDADAINGVEEVTIEERTLTEPETKKKEEIVKSMKKGLSGFKDRYGDRAKEVMYATATKQAKENA